jgi:hypothetical protein
MNAPFVFSSIQPYLPVAIAVFFYLEFMWGGALPPHSSRACHTLASIGSLPFSKHTGGGGTTPAFSGCLVYLQFTCVRVPLPPSVGQCHTLATVTSFPLSKVAGQVLPLLPSLASLFIYSLCKGVPLPHSLELRAPCPLCFVPFFSSSCLLFSLVFSLFSLGGGQSVQGAMLIFPRVVCGSTTCCLAHLVVCFSQAG